MAEPNVRSSELLCAGAVWVDVAQEVEAAIALCLHLMTTSCPFSHWKLENFVSNYSGRCKICLN